MIKKRINDGTPFWVKYAVIGLVTAVFSTIIVVSLHKAAGTTTSLPPNSAHLSSVPYWEVKWTARNGEYWMDTFPCNKVFISEEGANNYAESLRQAFKLLQYKSGTKVTIKKHE